MKAQLRRYRSARNACIFAKDFAGEGVDFAVRCAPGIARQAGFVAGFLKKFLAGKLMFGGDLRKQQTAVIFCRD